jgi:hypothetical protein
MQPKLGNSGNLTPCIGCGALVPDVDGPTHRYIGASPGCSGVFGEVMAKEFGEYRYPPVHHLTVDTYAVQHPGTPSRQSIQSVAVHLISLFCVLERGLDSERAIEAMRRALRYSEEFEWLEPPPSPGALTVVDVAKARDFGEHEDLVRRWAESVWDAWSPHHETVKRWGAK